MRVLHIDTGRHMRGGQWQVLHLLQGLAARGVDSVLLAPRSSPLFDAAAPLNLTVYPLPPSPPFFLSRRFDLTHAHDAGAHTRALFCRAPLVVSRRVGFPLKRTPLSRFKYRRATHYLAVSEFVKQILVGAGVRPDKVSVVYDGVHLPSSPLSRHGKGVLALDSSDPGKGKSILEEASRLAGLSINFSTQLTRDLPDAAAFVYITEMEGLGSAALLAMAYGVPVIASRVGGLPEIVRDGETGILVRNQPQAIAAEIRRLMEDRELATRLARRARQEVERRFTVTHMVENTLRVYRQVLG